MNDNKKLTSLIIVLVLTITVILGGTLAYWQWATSTAQQTLVNVSLTDDAKMYIDFPSNELTNMYPTSDCEANGTSSWVTEITVDNGTGVLLSPKFKLKVKIQDKNGNIITNVTNSGNSNPNRHYIKFAVTGENESCKNALYTGRFAEDTETVNGNDTWFDSELITLYDEDTNFPIVSGRIGSGVSFYAQPNTQTKQRYKVYVWLDKDYVSVTQGTTSTDTMQDAKITVSWSENSGLEQVKKAPKTGEAIAIYSEDDKSLRFYRETNPSSVTVGSTYNGRTATMVYTGFETATYTADTVPWDGIKTSIKIVSFEDYIYPISTAYWFKDFNILTSIDLTKLDTSNVTNMSSMFSYTTKLTELDIAHFNTSNVTTMNGMFCFAGVINLEIGNWDVSNVTGMAGMFAGANNLTTLDIEDWDVSNVTTMSSMFYPANGITSLDLSGWNVCNISNYSHTSYFTDNANIIQPHFGNAARCNGNTNVGKENAVGEAYAVYFEEDDSLRFYRSMTPITVGSTFDGRSVTEVYTGFETVTSSFQFHDASIIVFEDYVYPLMMSYWFSFDGDTISYIDVTKLDTSSATEITYLFYHTTVEKIIGIENWNTSNVTNMNALFGWVGGFPEEIDLSNWDTSNVTDMSYMFHIGASAKGFENWDVSNVVNMENMFCNYTIKYDVDLSGWDTSKVTNMNSMFWGTKIMNSLNLSGWNVCETTWYDGFTSNENIQQPYFGDSTKCNGGNPA